MSEEHHIKESLARELLDHPEDHERWSIYADLLQRTGSAHGQLIALDRSLESGHGSGAAELAAMAKAADDLREQLAPKLLGPLAAPNLPVPMVARWRFGHLSEVALDLRRGWMVTHRRRPQHIVKLLFAQPAARYLRVLRIRAQPRRGMNELAEALQFRPAPPLVELHVGDPAVVRQRPSGPHELGREPHVGLRWQLEWRMTTLLRAHPRLRLASLWGEVLRIPCRPGGKQERQAAVRGVRADRLHLTALTTLGRALWDRSEAVTFAALEKCSELGPAAHALVPALCLMLKPPLGRSDARASLALEALGTMGPAAVPAVETICLEWDYFLNHRRGVEVIECLAKLGPVARPALGRLEQVRGHGYPGHTPADYVQHVRDAARRAVAAIEAG